MGAADLLTLVRKGVNVSKVHVEARKPFRFLLCGDPGLVASLRALLLFVPDDATVPDDAASTLETIDPERRQTILGPDARCVIFLGRPGDVAGARLDLLRALKLPIFAVTVDPLAAPTAVQPLAAPTSGVVAEYTVARLDRETLRGRVFPHVIERCRGAEVAVGRRLPAMRETVAAKLTRDAASSALKIAAASAVVENVPFLGLVMGAVTTAGDLVGITGIQIVLMMQIGATYGKDPDMARIWELLPIVGGGLGWRTLSRELSGFVPVAGIAIKGAIAYAGTIVVGEGVGFFYEHGRHMTPLQASALYDEKKRSALSFARDVVGRLRKH
ncbi:MAG: hypothetical protein NVS2B8_03510 [Vulcanimicrobiaceae bacterium]